MYGPIKCISKDQDISVGMYEEKHQDLEINLSIAFWSNYTDEVIWKPEEDIISLANHLKVVIFMKSKHFDFTDIANPIKYFMRTEEMYLNPNLTKYAWMTLK